MTDFYHVTKDPVHGTMQFTSAENNWIKPFIDSQNFQRLRHIKQLGMVDYVFPGAVHTRFNHSLGCCYIASQIAQKIKLSDKQKQLVMIACLLHDIGHGPFSHAFEDIFINKSIRHEDWTPYFLEDYLTPEFFISYNKKNPKHALDEQQFGDIAAMIMHKGKMNPVMADIVSSQLDADRLDYLLRDNHFCGVRYGQFDLSWMLHCLAIVATPRGKRLGVTHKGIGVVEHYLMARRLMTRNIYHLQKKLAYEFLLVQFLAKLASNLDKHSDLNQSLPSLAQFLQATKLFNEQGAKNKSDFLRENYTLYRSLCDYDVYLLIQKIAQDQNHHLQPLASRIAQRVMPKNYKLYRLEQSEAEKALSRFKEENPEILDWQIGLIKSPHQSYRVEEPIYVINDRGETKPISDYSLIIQALSEIKEEIAFIYVDRPLLNHKKVKAFIEQI